MTLTGPSLDTTDRQPIDTRLTSDFQRPSKSREQILYDADLAVNRRDLCPAKRVPTAEKLLTAQRQEHRSPRHQSRGQDQKDGVHIVLRLPFSRTFAHSKSIPYRVGL